MRTASPGPAAPVCSERASPLPIRAGRVGKRRAPSASHQADWELDRRVTEERLDLGPRHTLGVREVGTGELGTRKVTGLDVDRGVIFCFDAGVVVGFFQRNCQLGRVNLKLGTGEVGPREYASGQICSGEGGPDKKSLVECGRL